MSDEQWVLRRRDRYGRWTYMAPLTEPSTVAGGTLERAHRFADESVAQQYASFGNTLRRGMERDIGGDLDPALEWVVAAEGQARLDP